MSGDTVEVPTSPESPSLARQLVELRDRCDRLVIQLSTLAEERRHESVPVAFERRHRAGAR